MTPATLKRFLTQHKGLIQKVKDAQEHAHNERTRVDQYILPIFQKYQFTHKRTGQPLTHPEQLYLAGDDDSNEKTLEQYYQECDDAHRTHGFTGPQGHCPALTSENKAIQLENELLKITATQLLGLKENPSIHRERRKKLLNLIMTNKTT